METIRFLVDQHASAEAKIALFRSLFRGREDVYPRRFESRKTGTSGYVRIPAHCEHSFRFNVNADSGHREHRFRSW
jgi:hypothetical protein